MRQTPIIPIITEEAQNQPFSIKPLNWFFQNDPSWQAHCHNYFEIIWVWNGGGSILIDLQSWPLKSNEIYCIKPGQVHILHPENETKGFVFSIQESFLAMGEHEFDLTCHTSLLLLLSNGHPISIEEEMADDMKELVARMEKELANSYVFRTQLLRRYFKIYLIYLTRRFEEVLQTSQPSRNTVLVQQFMELLEKNYKEKKMVSAYASQLSVTPNYLNEIIKKNTGFSAGHHIRQRVVLEAKRLAAYSNRSMKEIAYFLGFSDSAHFSKFFRLVTGFNFSDFKRKQLVISVTGTAMAPQKYSGLVDS